jgi:hypothetical protein
MKKYIFIVCAGIAFCISGFSVYSYMNERDRYNSLTVVPEKRNDLPLYKGLEFREHDYAMKGNHWYTIYNFYKSELPQLGWKLIHKQASLEGPGGGFMMSWKKDDNELFIGGGWHPEQNQTEIIFDLRPLLRNSAWIDSIPDEICMYEDSMSTTCSKLTDKNKIKQIVEWVNEGGYDKEDAPLQKEFGIIEVNGMKIEIHYNPALPSYTLKSEFGRKEMKPEPQLLELTGLTHLKNK